ncbi:hypothetical protein TELCIR_23736 [Teladorsagia circumcincta]|uniref:Uncharacterized protein n=1 Tax=Teladorsagia circumcincta TaxID=45464 RepID=A0A2G9TA97_TELCI|nr:hypothetical protein TELCIR_23736 [Teladorsagia circumcincta]
MADIDCKLFEFVQVYFVAVDPNNVDSEKSNLLDNFSDFLDEDRSSSINAVDRVENINYTSSDVDRVSRFDNLQ